MMDLAVSVVIPSYNRADSVFALVAQLAEQSLAKEAYEVIVVDDGSKIDPTARLAPLRDRVRLHVERQSNGGAAVARQKGADLAKGRLLLFLDDDMRIAAGFLKAHIAAHAGAARTVVLGRLRALPGIEKMPLFERFYARMLDRIAEKAASGEEELKGVQLYTGNMSLPRDLFFEVGGFDPGFRLIEDVELGVRLEKAGASFVFSSEAESVHGSDHVSQDKWMARSRNDGVYATRVARKHPDAPTASPWWHWDRLNRLSRPLLFVTAGAPRLGGAIGLAAMTAARVADTLGFSKVAVGGATLVYGIQYYRGVREETGTARDVIREYGAFREAMRRVEAGTGEIERDCLDAIRADHKMLRHYQAKYGNAPPRPLPVDAVQNIGFQLLIAYRIMRACRANGHALAAKSMSRIIRHLYGSDIHWDAEFAPGIVVVHGFGMAISGSSRVSEGCILFQHITLGLGLDPDTRASGAPRLERNVHVGVGATLLGPITVGAESKIMPGCALTRSVPARSKVESPVPKVSAR